MEIDTYGQSLFLQTTSRVSDKACEAMQHRKARDFACLSARLEEAASHFR
jgi:hypothetical protein